MNTPRTILHLLGPVKTNKADYFTKHHPPIHHTVMRYEYLHKSNHSLSFLFSWGCNNYELGLTSPSMSQELRSPNYDRQEPGGSMSECLTLVQKKMFPKSNRQESRGSIYDRLPLIINKIHHTCTKNNITAPFNNSKHEIYITQKCIGMNQKYFDIRTLCRSLASHSITGIRIS